MSTRESESKSHECAACGGSGKKATVGLPRLSQDWRDRVCPVCLGSGRVSDVIPARDAVADAETLHLASDDGRLLPGLHLARIAAEWAEHWIRTTDRTGYRPPKPIGHSDKAYSSAARAARAAFRACPGLRGGE